jgi:hypothetical protein
MERVKEFIKQRSGHENKLPSTGNPYIEMTEQREESNNNMFENAINPVLDTQDNHGHQLEKEHIHEPQITTFDRTPSWLKDNEFLLRGYRVNFNRKRDLFKSLFRMHNETLNIWTHLIGGLIFVGFFFSILIWFNESQKTLEGFIDNWRTERPKFSEYVL